MIFEGVQRVESIGSIWELDFDLARYRRFPKVEKPDAIRGQGGESLRDFVWHGMTGAKVRDEIWGGYRLVLYTVDGSGVATAPLDGDHELWEWVAP